MVRDGHMRYILLLAFISFLVTAYVPVEAVQIAAGYFMAFFLFMAAFETVDRYVKGRKDVSE